MIYVGNAPCSWGTLEFEGEQTDRITYARMLDELAETGYTGTELGDWGFMPTEPDALSNELKTRHLTMTGAFVPIAFKRREAHDEGEARAVRTAKLLASVANFAYPPFIVLADDSGSDFVRVKNAGRVTGEMMLSDEDWHAFAEGVNRVARAVKQQTGLRAVFHHHCAGYVETPEEIERLLALTDPDAVGLVFDTGHFAFGSGHSNAQAVMDALTKFASRIWYVHLKDCSPEVAARATREGWDYHTSILHGVFCELGQGCVPFAQVVYWLKQRNYDGFVTVEQDVLTGMGTPKESARRNREYLRRIGLI